MLPYLSCLFDLKSMFKIDYSWSMYCLITIVQFEIDGWDLKQRAIVCFYNNREYGSWYLSGLKKRSNVWDLRSDPLTETYEANWIEDKCKI